MAAKARVLLADDHAVVRKGIQAILADEPNLTVVGEATTGEEAQQLCKELRPDILLLDLSMPGPTASATMTFVHTYSPWTRVVILTAYHDDVAVRELVTTGARGYVLKDDAPDAVAGAVRSVAQGGTWFSPPVMATLLNGQRSSPGTDDAAALTGRERELLDLLKNGWDNGRIAAQLHLGEQTVRNYLHRLYGKLGVGSRAEAAVWAHEHDREYG